MVKYIIVHTKHDGCYDFPYFEDEAAKLRLTSITINPPKIFMFDDKEQAHDFFEEYINDVDVIDSRCKRKDDVVHLDFCSCGIIEMDEDDNPILFYNKINQIFLLQHGPQIFLPPQEAKNDMKNLNITNNLIRKTKTLSGEQRKRYIELGKYCQECFADDKSENNDKSNDEKSVANDKNNNNVGRDENIILQTNEDSNSGEDTKKPQKKPRAKSKPKPKTKSKKDDA
jgi:hypothetical protein